MKKKPRLSLTMILFLTPVFFLPSLGEEGNLDHLLPGVSLILAHLALSVPCQEGRLFVLQRETGTLRIKSLA